MASRDKIVKKIKDGGALIIYVGTASLMKPYITKDNAERSAVGKVCSIASGATISIGVAGYASRIFNKVVDEVVEFIDDIRKPKSEVKTGGDENA